MQPLNYLIGIVAILAIFGVEWFCRRSELALWQRWLIRWVALLVLISGINIVLAGLRETNWFLVIAAASLGSVLMTARGEHFRTWYRSNIRRPDEPHR